MTASSPPSTTKPSIMTNVWRDLPRPIHGLAPMEDVTDTVFRRLIIGWGRPDVVFTEFIHAGLVIEPRGKRPGLSPRLVHSPIERPIVAQIWGNDPEQYARASLRLRELGFDAIDINMGCPVPKIRNRGACSALIRNPTLASELIDAAKTGGLPVSVKTRIGFDRVETEEWAGHLLSSGIDALTLHGRTATQESEGPVLWEEIARAARIARTMGAATAVLGNGDVMSRHEIDTRCARYGLDGVLVGRGVFADPLLFNADPSARGFRDMTDGDRVAMLGEHVALYREVWGSTRNYEILKKFYKIYLQGLSDPTLRDDLNRTHDYASAESVIGEWFACRRDATRATGCATRAEPTAADAR
ncbi:MAG: tRNA-dihydrouridine synthase [Spirochaetaceae bacterium]|nr:MAG: tRNA-dihydrouridine synthase [Spirochaetaceae bacterium]